MSLIALLSLSSSSSTVSPSTSKLLDVYERVPLQAKLRRNAHGALKPQQLHFKLYGVRPCVSLSQCVYASYVCSYA